MKKHRWAVAFTACLLAFTTYISLDTFVLSNAYQTNATEINLSGRGRKRIHTRKQKLPGRQMRTAETKIPLLPSVQLPAQVKAVIPDPHPKKKALLRMRTALQSRKTGQTAWLPGLNQVTA